MTKLLFTTIDIVHKKEYEFMQGSEQLLRVETCICYDEIIAVRQHCEEEDPIINPDMCVVYLKSGEVFFVFTPYEEVLGNLKSR